MPRASLGSVAVSVEDVHENSKTCKNGTVYVCGRSTMMALWKAFAGALEPRWSLVLVAVAVGLATAPLL